jgi:transposase
MQWFLAEECDTIVDISTISKQLKKADWTNKRVHILAAQRDEDLRNYYLFKLHQKGLTAEMFVFVDESGLDKRDGARRTGWAPKGVTPLTTSLLRRGKRYHLLPALTLKGLLDALVYQGSTNREGFKMWLETRVLPRMTRFPGPQSVLVMDNASWHHGDEIYTMCDKAGILLLYLPPYSPDFNPIEEYFGDLKRYIRRHYRECTNDWAPDEEFAEFLYNSAFKVAENKKTIAAHFRHSRVPFQVEE